MKEENYLKNKIKLIIKDARITRTSSLVVKYNPDYIFHLAAVAHANVSNKDPFSTFDHSMRTLENLLDISRNIKKLKTSYISHLVLFMVNSKQKQLMKKLFAIPSIYGSLNGRKIVIGYNQVFNLPYTTIRPSALYGPRCVSGRVLQCLLKIKFQEKN